MASESVAIPVHGHVPPNGNRLGRILADASTLPDADVGVLLVWLRGMRNGVDIDSESLRSTSDADLRKMATGRNAA